ncbi:MAG: hypothetical protein JKY48_20655 [Flavobacteriales bacterium]|nr:hypothetical protein [Flavobacteriales bacterium]
MEKQIIDTCLKAMMEKWPYSHASTIANKLYNIDGMSEADVQINITEHADTKIKYIRAYSEDVRRNLRKFIPLF